MTDASASDVDIGRVLDGRYRLVEQIGEGGMGKVYRAVHLGLDRPVALKLLVTEHATGEEIRRRFDREAKTLAAMSHPHIVTITDYGVADETPFLVMELLEGRALDVVLSKEGALGPGEARHVFLQILRALAYAHASNIAHRDLKPANVFLQSIPGAPDHVKLLDFGLAKFVGEEQVEREGAHITRTGAILGTPAYMSPEQATGQAADARSDVYAAGVLLFEMLAGRRPYEGPTPEIMRQHLIAPIPRIEEKSETRTGSPELERFLGQAMAKERQARFADAREMLAAFDALPDPLVTIGPRRSLDEVQRITSAPTVLAGAGGRDSGATSAFGRTTAPTQKPAAEATVEGGLSAKAVLIGIAALVGVGGLAVGGIVIAGKFGGGPAEDDPTFGAATASQVEESGESATNASTRGAPGEDDTQAAPRGGAATPTATRSSGSEGGAGAPSLPLPTLNPSPGVDEATAAAPSEPIDPSASPWSRGTPRALRSIKSALDRGRPMSSAAERVLRTYVRDHNDDARAYILFGRGYARRGWRPDAVERFERAYRLDPSTRNDPRVLEALVDLASHANVATRAQALIREMYGSSATEAVDRRLARRDLDDADRARLERFRATL